MNVADRAAPKPVVVEQIRIASRSGGAGSVTLGAERPEHRRSAAQRVAEHFRVGFNVRESCRLQAGVQPRIGFVECDDVRFKRLAG